MKKNLIILVFVSLFTSANAQQALTFYNMDRVMQSQFVNPSANIDYKFQIGGLLVPVFGQLPPPMYFNYANNAIHYNHIFHMGKGDKADNLVLDLPLMMRKLKKTTHFRFDTQLELLNIGIKLENMYLTFALSEKFNYGFSLPYDLFEFAVHGNIPYMREGKPHNLNGFGLYLNHYREFAVGASMNANEDLSLGGRVKFLFGQSNFNTDIKKLSIYTDPENYIMTWTSDMKIQTSSPFTYNYLMTPDSINFSINQEEFDELTEDGAMAMASAFLLNMKNIGLGFDFGANYKISPEIEVYGSLTDFGFISWNNNPYNFISKGKYDFRGIEFKVFDDSDDKIQESVDNLVDTLINTFKFDLLETNYMTWLPSSLYLGAKYKFHEKLHFNVLYRGEIYKKSYLQSLTIGASSNITDWLSAYLTWSYANNSLNNIGIGLNVRAAIFNWYVVTDSFTNMIYPQKTKNFNIRMGCNMTFGYKKIKSSASIRT
ncbi:MAG: hypothetical protein GX793_03385 [Bacteroidales bacterium]|nr:DUF5723 family protein [Bacteroidales bacterium]MCK9498907.1 DUF5723 family protein [Bacteroidales bacterium]MDY0313874.1 DUF5723 family protein [Bacteroidales bacterium]NLB86087.1 hypothetical protein [Bacteroidales bacterium]